MKILLAVALAAFSAPVLASSWTSYEQLQGASRVNLKADLETQSREAGTSFNGSRDVEGYAPSSSGPASSSPERVAKPGLSPKKDKIEPPSPEEAKRLKLVRTGGLAVAGLGLGFAALSVATGGALPILALAAVFIGGLAAYLAHRRLKGKSAGILG